MTEQDSSVVVTRDSVLSGPSRSYIAAEQITISFSDAIIDFSCKFMQKLFDSPIATNDVISPVSAYILLSIIQRGAEGISEAVLEKTLHVEATISTLEEIMNLVTSISERGDRGIDVEFATSAFYSEVFDSFMAETSMFYQCEEFPSSNLTDKLASEAMQKWISINKKINTTQFLLQGMCENEHVVFALCSALYFRCEWAKPCNCQRAGNIKFNVRPLKVSKAPSFYYEAICRAWVSQEMKFQWVHLNLEKDMFSLMLVMPTHEHTLDDVISSLTPDLLSSIMREDNLMHVKLKVPLFSLKQETDLKPILLKLGLQDLYDGIEYFNGLSCKNMKMTSLQNIQLSVNLAGVSTENRKGQEETGKIPKTDYQLLELVFNHPFLVFLVDRKNFIPLLIGRVKHPKYDNRKCIML